MKKFLVALSCLMLFAVGCVEESIEGTWRSTNPSQASEVTFKDGAVYGDGIPADMSYRLVDEASPRQIYLSARDETGELKEAPFAIYKIEDHKLILKYATEYVRTIGVIPMGSRYEFPDAFT